MVGKTLKVLCEDFDPVNEALYGRSYADAPEIDGKVFFTAGGKSPALGEFVDVEIYEVIVYFLVGHVK
jgi:ribosomal protein S12 methylthiotransferase